MDQSTVLHLKQGLRMLVTQVDVKELCDEFLLGALTQIVWISFELF